MKGGSTMLGRTIRMRQIFRRGDGKALVVALDHGAIAGPLQGIEKPLAVLRECAAGGADAVLATRGFASAAAEGFDGGIALILRLTGGFTTLGGKFEEEMVCEPETALAYGASAAAVTVKFGHAREGSFARQAALAACACERLGLPMLIEALPKAEGLKPNDPGALLLAARAAQELGADIVKTRYSGDGESFSRIVAGCPAPVLILGGEHQGDLGAVFREVRESIDSGGAGVAMGRNVWQGGKAQAVTEALCGLIHESWTVAQALAHAGR
jgi:DhnA family fructose-bisphosphate aldolase class Ia